MVIHNFNVKSVAVLPVETDPPLVVDANAELTGAVPFEQFQTVPRRQAQIGQLARAMKLRELAEGNALNLRRKTVVPRAKP